MHRDQRRAVYASSRWQRVRALVLADQPICRYCQIMDRVTPATVVDHITPMAQGGQPYDLGNLQALCKPCHDSAKAAEEARGYSTATGADGWPVDTRHPANADGVRPKG